MSREKRRLGFGGAVDLERKAQARSSKGLSATAHPKEHWESLVSFESVREYDQIRLYL